MRIGEPLRRACGLCAAVKAFVDLNQLLNPLGYP